MSPSQKMPSASAAAPRRQHPHFCLFGTVHLATAMKMIIIVGLLAIAALCTLEAIHLRRALTVMILPFAVCLITVVALCRNDSRLLWPIVGVSFFHIFLDIYLSIVFLFIFFFKPIYLLMVFNWAFDTLHTTKTLSFYIYCSIIFTILLVFFLYNLWQLRTALRFQTFLEELGSNSSASGSTNSSSASSEPMVAPKSNGIETQPKISEPFQMAHAANGVSGPLHQCKLLNEPPILMLGDGITCSAIGGAVGCVAGTARRRSRSPGTRRNAHSVQQQPPQPMRTQQPNGGNNGIYAQLGGRRPSLRENRQFGTNRINC